MRVSTVLDRNSDPRGKYKTEQVVFRNINVRTYTHVKTIDERESLNLKESKMGYRGGFGGSKGKGK